MTTGTRKPYVAGELTPHVSPTELATTTLVDFGGGDFGEARLLGGITALLAALADRLPGRHPAQPGQATAGPDAGGLTALGVVVAQAGQAPFGRDQDRLAQDREHRGDQARGHHRDHDPAGHVAAVTARTAPQPDEKSGGRQHGTPSVRSTRFPRPRSKRRDPHAAQRGLRQNCG